MNDRFKFRVWDKENEIWLENGDCSLSMDGELTVLGMDAYGETMFCDSKNYLIEQCTGLKDKTGKLIYENDLIKCLSGIYRIAVDDFGLWTAIYKNNPFEGVCEWSNMVKEYAFNQNNVEIEVVDNIHENADLLELKQDD